MKIRQKKALDNNLNSLKIFKFICYAEHYLHHIRTHAYFSHCILQSSVHAYCSPTSSNPNSTPRNLAEKATIFKSEPDRDVPS